MPVQPKEYELKEHPPTHDKANQADQYGIQAPPSKDGTPGAALVLDGTEGNERLDIGHPKGSRILLEPGGGALFKSTGEMQLICTGEIKVNGNNIYIGSGGFVLVHGAEVQVEAQVKILGDVLIQGDVTIEGNTHTTGNATIDGNLDVGNNINAGGDITNGGNLTTNIVNRTSCPCC